MLQNRQVLPRFMPTLLIEDTTLWAEYQPIPNDNEMLLLEYDGRNFLYLSPPDGVSEAHLWKVFEVENGDYIACNYHGHIDGTLVGYLVASRPYHRENETHVMMDY